MEETHPLLYYLRHDARLLFDENAYMPLREFIAGYEAYIREHASWNICDYPWTLDHYEFPFMKLKLRVLTTTLRYNRKTFLDTLFVLGVCMNDNPHIRQNKKNKTR